MVGRQSPRYTGGLNSSHTTLMEDHLPKWKGSRGTGNRRAWFIRWRYGGKYIFYAFAPLCRGCAILWKPEIFALMLLAFATFIGLGGDDIPKTIFSICIGLVY